MCVIAIAKHTKIAKRDLRDMERRNSDGGGIAWIEDDGKGKAVHWEKGLDAGAVHKISQEKPLPHIVHFRIATAGGALPALCHPFPMAENAPPYIAGRAPQVLFHNGHWSAWDDVLKTLLFTKGDVSHLEGPWSDSRLLAFLASNGDMKLLESIYYGKVATLDWKGKILTYGSFSRVKNGVMVSNTNYLSCVAGSRTSKTSSGERSATVPERFQSTRSPDVDVPELDDDDVMVDPVTRHVGGFGTAHLDDDEWLAQWEALDPADRLNAEYRDRLRATYLESDAAGDDDKGDETRVLDTIQPTLAGNPPSQHKIALWCGGEEYKPVFPHSEKG